MIRIRATEFQMNVFTVKVIYYSWLQKSRDTRKQIYRFIYNRIIEFWIGFLASSLSGVTC